MARVPPTVQFKRYQQVRKLFVARRSIFSYVDGRGQSALYVFYRPHEDHLPESLAVHQRQVAKQDPSLPHRAGKAYVSLMNAADAMARAETERPIAKHLGHTKGKRPKRVIVARGVQRPEPDLNKLAMVLIRLAEQREREASTQTEHGA